MGVCCIVFDIDGILFAFFIIFLNIEKNKIVRILFSIFHVFFRVLCYFQHKKMMLKNFRGGGGGGCRPIFFRKTILSFNF